MNQNDKKPPRVVIADKFIKNKSIITIDGKVIKNTKENPTAVEDYLKSKRQGVI